MTIECDKGRYHTLKWIGQGMPMSPRVLVRFPDDMRLDRRVRLHASLPERRELSLAAITARSPGSPSSYRPVPVQSPG